MANTSTPVTTVRSLQGDTLSGIVWRHTGKSSGLVESVLDANPHLAHMPAVLHAGVLVRLPQPSQITNTPQPVRLWD
jgi:phage tail protein X